MEPPGESWTVSKVGTPRAAFARAKADSGSVRPARCVDRIPGLPCASTSWKNLS